MKERPILFNTEMVKAILEGRKTQTRRVIKPQPDAGLSPSDSYSHIEVGKYHPTMINKDGDAYPGDEIFGAYTEDGEWGWKCPYGQVGDRLWVRETFVLECDCEYQYEPFYKLATDRPIKSIPAEGEFSGYHLIPHYRATEPEPMITEGEDERGFLGTKWKPSIFMPRWASRINLEITEIRVERLQGISIDDIRAEGFDGDYTKIGDYYVFGQLWNSLNPKYPWESNPWVWVLTFKVI